MPRNCRRRREHGKRSHPTERVSHNHRPPVRLGPRQRGRVPAWRGRYPAVHRVWFFQNESLDATEFQLLVSQFFARGRLLGFRRKLAADAQQFLAGLHTIPLADTTTENRTLRWRSESCLDRGLDGSSHSHCTKVCGASVSTVTAAGGGVGFAEEPVPLPQPPANKIAGTVNSTPATRERDVCFIEVMKSRRSSQWDRCAIPGGPHRA